MLTQSCEFNRGNPEGETTHQLYFEKLTGLIDAIDTRLADRRYEFLLRPIPHAAQSDHFRDTLTTDSTEGQMSDVMEHLIRILCGRTEPRRNLTLLDLSGIPFDVLDVTVAVITRLLFDLNFWTPAHERHPILLVYEEAHNYVPRVETGRAFAKQAVERVAKEGRKRPAELSETVLAQCNNMVVMRMNNPDDQTYISRVVSDHFSSLLGMLPVLRRGEAFVLGDAVLMPLRTLIQLPERLPRSGDVDFFQLWSAGEPSGDISRVIDHWWRQDRQILNQLPDEGGPEPVSEPPLLRISIPDPLDRPHLSRR
jgi:hypothetical protein